jgi:hypothetical protein
MQAGLKAQDICKLVHLAEHLHGCLGLKGTHLC